MKDYSQYYNQIKDAQLELVEDGKTTKTFLLRKYPDSHMMSCWLIFAPFGIVIGGDLRVTQHGLIIYGYGMSWFAEKLEPDYLASKCLEEKWSSDYARKAFEEWAKDIQETIDQEKAEIRKDRAEWYEIEESAVTEAMIAEITDEPSYPVYTWNVLHHHITGTMADAIKELLRDSEVFESPHTLYQSLPAYQDPENGGRYVCPFDSDDLGRAYGYFEGEIGWLYAIQRRFSECYQAMQQVKL